MYVCYDNSFINNHYSHIITGNHNIVNNERLHQLISKDPKYRESKQVCFEKPRKEIQTGIDQLRKYQMTKVSIHNLFSEWKSHFVISK